MSSSLLSRPFCIYRKYKRERGELKPLGSRDIRYKESKAVVRKEPEPSLSSLGRYNPKAARRKERRSQRRANTG